MTAIDRDGCLMSAGGGQARTRNNDGKGFGVVRFNFSKQFPRQPVFNFTPDLSVGEFKVRRSWKISIHNSFSAPAPLIEYRTTNKTHV